MCTCVNCQVYIPGYRNYSRQGVYRVGTFQKKRNVYTGMEHYRDGTIQEVTQEWNKHYGRPKGDHSVKTLSLKIF